MYFTRSISIIGLSSILFFVLNCSEVPIQTDLSNNSQSLDTLSLADISGFTYQISPEISSYQKLYVGHNSNFSFPISLLKFPSTGWDTFLDSSVTIDSIFLKVYSGDSLINSDLNLVLHFSPDSVFSELNSYVDQFSDIGLSQWTNLGAPNVSIISDTSDTISHFQESILDWELSDLINTLTDTTISDRTFSLSFSENMDSTFIELYSREYSSGDLDPKIEVYYRSEQESVIDTLTRIIYVAEDISAIDNPLSSGSSDNSIIISRGRGYRSIINIPFDSLSLPPFSVIRYAHLFLYQKGDSDSDPYENLGAHYSTFSTAEGKLQISLKSYFQSILMVDSLKNVGMKFSSSINNSLFDSVEFDLSNDKNRVDILYVSP